MRLIPNQNAASSKITVTSTATLLYSLINTGGSVTNSQKYFGSDTLNGVGVANGIVITPEDGNIRMGNGITPTSTQGTLLTQGTKYSFPNVTLENLKLIRITGDVVCSVDLAVCEVGDSYSGVAETVSLLAADVSVVELPAAAASADNFANPTTTNIMSMGMLYDGATWDRAKGDSTDGALVNLGANNDVTVTSGTVTANAGTNLNTSALSTSAKQDTLLTELQLKADLTETQPVSLASVPLPSGASTSALQGGGLPAALGAGGGLKVDGSGTALPVSAASLPLPSGASTLAEQQTQTASLSVLDDWDNAASDGASVSGDVAHDSADAGEPVKIGGKGVTAVPTAVTANDRVNAQFDIYGRQVGISGLREMKGQQITTITSSTSETTIVTADATYKLDLYGIIVVNTSATATEISVKDSTAGTTRFWISVPANDMRGFMLPMDAGHLQAAANNNWTATCADSVASVIVTALFVKNL